MNHRPPQVILCSPEPTQMYATFLSGDSGRNAFIVKSSNGGQTWARTVSGFQGFGAIVTSTDGSVVVAQCGNNGLPVYRWAGGDPGVVLQVWNQVWKHRCGDTGADPGVESEALEAQPVLASPSTLLVSFVPHHVQTQLF